jgi:hypothetical protein
MIHAAILIMLVMMGIDSCIFVDIMMHRSRWLVDHEHDFFELLSLFPFKRESFLEDPHKVKTMYRQKCECTIVDKNDNDEEVV